MHFLVVFCHPSIDSFSARLARDCVGVLREVGHSVVFRDLYEEGFNPVMSCREFNGYENPSINCLEVKRYAGDLTSVQGVILVYPTWWYGMPAMMKGYFDRVWLPGSAFDIRQDRSISTNSLRHITRFMVVTSYGSPWWWIRLWMGDPAKKAVMRGFRRLFAPNCKMSWSAMYNMDLSTGVERERFARKVRTRLRLFVP